MGTAGQRFQRNVLTQFPQLDHRATLETTVAQARHDDLGILGEVHQQLVVPVTVLGADIGAHPTREQIRAGTALMGCVVGAIEMVVVELQSTTDLKAVPRRGGGFALTERIDLLIQFLDLLLEAGQVIVGTDSGAQPEANKHQHQSHGASHHRAFLFFCLCAPRRTGHRGDGGATRP